MKLWACDLFCGAGGTSAGAEATGEAKVVFAVNHWNRAVETHQANFPECRHVNSRLEDVSPSEVERINLLFASPECTHHSRARGGKPTSDQQRSGAWDIIRWFEFHRPSWGVIENVPEFQEWGPVGNDSQPLASHKGKTFKAWLKVIESYGYKVDYRELNAADYGAATSRRRLFVIARKGNRMPVFPKATHANPSLPFFSNMNRLPWITAAEVIDWSIPCPSIFNRPRPLADKTLLRIEAGLRRFVGPFVSSYHCGADSARRNHGTDEPIPTIDTSNRYALAVPFQVILRNHGGDDERSYPVGNPLGTVTARNGKALVMPFQFQLIGRGAGKARGIDVPVPTIIAARENHGIVFPWMMGYYGNAIHSGIDSPVATITTKDRHALCVGICRGLQDWPAAESDAMRTLQATMRTLGICDVGFRMLANPELARAQGFRRDYIFHGTKSDVTRQIGNSVCPPVAEAITRVILSA